MRNIFFFILFVFVFIEAFSQKVQIVDSQTEKPIDNVFIYNLDKTIQTKSDFNGMVDLSIFNRKDLINFQHPSYHHFTAQVEDLLKVEQVLLTERIIEIGEVVISANKWEQNGEDIPNSIAIVNSKAINFENPQTSADVLELTGKVFVQKSQLGGGSPMLRGFAANSVLIIVDGVRVNNAIFRSGNLQNLLNIDPLSLSSAEVIFGPGSVIYGSDALGGIMDFHTIKPVFSPDSNKLSGTTNLRYSSANNEITSHLNLSYSTRKLSLFSAFTYSDFDDLRAGAKRPDKYPELGIRKEYIQRIENRDSIVANKEVNKLIHSGFSQYSTINKLNYKVSENMEINYGFYYSSTSDVPRYDRLIQYKNNTLRSAEWYYGPQIWMRNNLGLKYYGKRKLFDEFKSIIAFQQFEESRHTRDYQDIIKTSRYENVSVLSLNMDLNKELNDKTFLFYGIEGITNRIKSNAFSTDITTKQKVSASTRYPDGGSYYHSW
ncbi:MAG: TonB-dependent receptor plug domain-containing protein, partial [Cyclobacteriaceae bacterium]|nr:TonB-dependent receptor plug domain-containing protein [Cyclobacteriaceae bacterium]